MLDRRCVDGTQDSNHGIGDGIALRSNDHRLGPLKIRLLREMSTAELLRLQVVPSPGSPHPLWYADSVRVTVSLSSSGSCVPVWLR